MSNGAEIEPFVHALTVSDENLVVNHWRRWGKNRLYIEHTDGTKVGFWDLAEDVGRPESAEYEVALLSAVSRWKEQHPQEELAVEDITNGHGTPSCPHRWSRRPS